MLVERDELASGSMSKAAGGSEVAAFEAGVRMHRRIGEVVRDLCLGRASFVVVSPLSAGRFAADAFCPRAHRV
nr:hypothetical protein [Streptomyces sp. AC550_RSS872]